jgi:hypothetical protein
MIAIAHLVLVVTIGGMSLWLVLIRISGASTASSYHLLNPFFGVLLAYLILGGAVAHGEFHWGRADCNRSVSERSGNGGSMAALGQA